MGCDPPTPSIRILVVDDHCVVREGLYFLLECEPDLKIVGSAATGEEAVFAALLMRPHVIIMDLMLPSLNGIDATRRIISKLPQTRIIALSACHTTEHVYRVLRAGASGYVLKAEAGAELICAVRAVTAGKRFVSRAIAVHLEGGVLGATIPRSLFDLLSVREHDVLRRIVIGSTTAEIAQCLSLSPKTVESYRARMMTKLGVANRSELIRLALDYELPEV